MRGNVEEELDRLVNPWKTRLAETYSRQLYKCERRHVEVGMCYLPYNDVYISLFVDIGRFRLSNYCAYIGYVCTSCYNQTRFG